MEREGDADHWSVASLKNATAYVTLEPCSHVGKTPPCCDALVKAGCARVVIGMSDPAPWVSGNGARRLREEVWTSRSSGDAWSVGGVVAEARRTTLLASTASARRGVPVASLNLASGARLEASMA